MSDLDLMAAVLDHLDPRQPHVRPCGTAEAFRELQKLAMIYIHNRKHGGEGTDSPETSGGILTRSN